MSKLTSLFYVDTLSAVMLALVGFVGIIVALFSSRHLAGDRLQSRFFVGLAGLVLSVFVLVTADHLLVFLSAWAASNLLLALLMIHKASWRAARASGVLALQNFALGLAALGGAFALLYTQTGETSIHKIIAMPGHGPWLALGLAGLTIAGMTQSAIWPFHKWLTSSLNSPTTVSAMMHAGLVNGGGFLLARFAPLFLQLPQSLSVLFALGMVTAVLGTSLKLLQTDVKRMLACSTMGQMGFMIVQCGLGLFPAAIAHLCWHGLFKAYLFLGSGSAAQEKRLDLGYPPAPGVMALALLCGLGGAATFSLASHKDVWAGDTSLMLIGLAMLTGAQLAIPILAPSPYKRLLLAALATAGMGGLYGLSVYGIEALLAPLGILQPQPLSILHVLGFGVLALCWLAMLYGRRAAAGGPLPAWALRLYVQMINAGQPHTSTVTTHRNHYRTL